MTEARLEKRVVEIREYKVLGRKMQWALYEGENVLIISDVRNRLIPFLIKVRRWRY